MSQDAGAAHTHPSLPLYPGAAPPSPDPVAAAPWWRRGSSWAEAEVAGASGARGGCEQRAPVLRAGRLFSHSSELAPGRARDLAALGSPRRMLAAMDDAVGDSVDVLSISIGSTGAPMRFAEDGIAVGALHTARCGVVISVGEGDSGATELQVALLRLGE